ALVFAMMLATLALAYCAALRSGTMWYLLGTPHLQLVVQGAAVPLCGHYRRGMRRILGIFPNMAVPSQFPASDFLAETWRKLVWKLCRCVLEGGRDRVG